MHVLIVGHSHIRAMRRADAGQGWAHFVDLMEPELAPSTGAGAPRFGPQLQSRLKRELRGVRLVISVVGGNAHNLFGLVNHPRPFDFILDEQPELPLAQGHEVVPLAMVEEILALETRPDLDVLMTLRREVQVPMFHVESPPPIPSSDHIRRHPGIFVGELKTGTVAPRALRYKLWRLHSRLFRQVCSDADIGFIPAPAETFDAEGYLGQPFWNPDPTHGNARYGAHVLAQIAAVPIGSAA